jgi:hypothetical protein
MTTLPTKPINPLTATRADLAGVFRAAANIVDGGPLHTGGLWSNDHPYNWEPGVPISPAAALCVASGYRTREGAAHFRAKIDDPINAAALENHPLQILIRHLDLCDRFDIEEWAFAAAYDNAAERVVETFREIADELDGV